MFIKSDTTLRMFINSDSCLISAMFSGFDLHLCWETTAHLRNQFAKCLRDDALILVVSLDVSLTLSNILDVAFMH